MDDDDFCAWGVVFFGESGAEFGCVFVDFVEFGYSGGVVG